ncbi:unnamed protein product [Larinioides sclopetarius]|uniref:Uncharacterized protein n=1 Tax=Larinioides sclopetarius TaxID=280406 RepID=A0AAV2BL41_9ARAC
MSQLTFLVLFVFPLCFVQIGQCSPLNEKFFRGLVQFAITAETQLADKPIPDISHWRLQRIETINILKELREKLNNYSFNSMWSKVVDSTMSIFCKLAHLAEYIIKFLHSSLSEMNVSEFMCPAAQFEAKASSVIGSILSPEFQYNLQTILIKDREFSHILNEWVQSSLKLETEVQSIFGFDLKSKNSLYFLLLNEFNRLLSLTKNPKEALDLMKRGKYSEFLNKDFIDDLLLFKNSPLVSKKVQLSLFILSSLVSATKNDFVVHRNLGDLKISIIILSIWDKLGKNSPPVVKLSDYMLLKILDIVIEVTSFQNARKLITDDSNQYSDILGQIIEILEKEMTFIESSFSI